MEVQSNATNVQLHRYLATRFRLLLDGRVELVKIRLRTFCHQRRGRLENAIGCTIMALSNFG